MLVSKAEGGMMGQKPNRVSGIEILTENNVKRKQILLADFMGFLLRIPAFVLQFHLVCPLGS